MRSMPGDTFEYKFLNLWFGIWFCEKMQEQGKPCRRIDCNKKLILFVKTVFYTKFNIVNNILV